MKIYKGKNEILFTLPAKISLQFSVKRVKIKTWFHNVKRMEQKGGKEMEEHGPVQSIDRAFEILERLCGSRDGLSIHALSEATGLHKSTVHRLLAALAARGYVRKDEESGRYRMTTRICELSEQVVESLDVLKAAHGPMEALSQTTGETVHLVVREGDEIVYVHKVEPDVSTMRMFSRIGMRRPMSCTAMGKAILAELSDEEVDRIWNASDIQAYTEHTITSLDRLKSALELIRRRGSAFDNQENELGVRCIAATIHDYTGGICGALSISAPMLRMSDIKIAQFTPQLMAACEKITRRMGGI